MRPIATQYLYDYSSVNDSQAGRSDKIYLIQVHMSTGVDFHSNAILYHVGNKIIFSRVYIRRIILKPSLRNALIYILKIAKKYSNSRKNRRKVKEI